MREGRGLLQRKADLRIGGEVGAAALLARAGVGDDVAGRAIGEIGRACRRPFGDAGRNVHARPRRLAAGDAQRLQETFGDGIGLAAGQPPRARRRVEALDRHHIGNAEAREGVAHIAFPDETAQVGELRRQRLDRLALAAERIAEVVDQDRAGDLHFDRPGEGPLRHAVAGAGLEREHRVVAGGAGVEQVGGPEVGLIARQRQARRRAVQPGLEKRRGVERQQHRHPAAPDAGEDRRGHARSVAPAPAWCADRRPGSRRWPENVKAGATAGRVLISVRS